MKTRRWLVSKLALAALLAGATAANAQKPVDCDALRREIARLETMRGRIAQLGNDVRLAEQRYIDVQNECDKALSDVVQAAGVPLGSFHRSEEAQDNPSDTLAGVLLREFEQREQVINEQFSNRVAFCRKFPDTYGERELADLNSKWKAELRMHKQMWEGYRAAREDELRQKVARHKLLCEQVGPAEVAFRTQREALEQLESQCDEVKLDGARLALAMSGCDAPATNRFADVPAAEVTAPPEKPQGFGDSADVRVERAEPSPPTILSDATSGDLLSRFNDACSAQNWRGAAAILREARGASWHDTGVEAFRNERERAAEAGQLRMSKCQELEAIMLSASRRSDWASVQAYAAQAQAAGCRFSAETGGEIQRLWQEACAREQEQQLRQQQEQQMANLFGQLLGAALGACIQGEVNDHRNSGRPSATASPQPAPKPPPAAPKPPPRRPRRGGGHGGHHVREVRGVLLP